MTDTDKVTMGTEATKEMVEQLGKAFMELESHRDSSSQNKTTWEDIKQHFHNLGTSLEKKLTEVEEKERAFEEKQSEARKLIIEREAAVAVKEQSSLNRLQELKYTVISAIAESRKNCKVPTPVLVDAKGSKNNKVSTTVADDPSAPIPVPGENVTDNKSDDPAEVVAGEVKPRPQLKELCEQMDAKGLLKFLSDNRKNLATISQELSNALKSASEPARLVLDSLEGFFPPDQSNSQESEAALLLLRRICLVMMESAAPLLGILSSDIKQQAKAIADEWKAKLAGLDLAASNGYSLEAMAFLQLLETFSIADEFDEDELCKLVPAVSRRRQAPELCRSLGLSQKMPGLIETLINSRGRQIDAVHFAHAFQLTESFPPVPLLKEYLNNNKTTAEENTEGIATENGQKEDNDKELGALKIVVKTIQEYKLQEQYPVEPLKKRITQLEKEKHDKKRTAQTTNSQAKKARANGGYAAHRKPSIPVDNRQLPLPVYDERGYYSGPAERYPERYNYAAPPAYDMAAHAAYGQQPTAQRPYHYPDERVAPPAPYGTSSSYGNYAGADERVAPPAPYAPYGASSNSGSYSGAVYQSSIPNGYGNYMGAGGQAAPSTYGGYMGPGVPPSNQSYM